MMGYRCRQCKHRFASLDTLATHSKRCHLWRKKQ